MANQSRLLLLALLALSAGACSRNAEANRPANKPMSNATSPAWAEIERLEKEQKFEAASAAVDKLVLEARAANDEPTWARALVKQVQLRIGLHGYETAVLKLREQPWPKQLLPRTVVELFYAQALSTYLDQYSWEIGQRERIEAKGPIDLKSWTADQIQAEALAALDRVWLTRAALGEQPRDALGAAALTPNDFPERIRGTLRDVVSYHAVAVLANSSRWTAEESNDLYRLDLAGLAQTRPPTPFKLADHGLHPVAKIAAVLDDLAAWHTKAGRNEAVAETEIERARRLHSLFTNADDRRSIAAHLLARLATYRQLSWWSVGMAELAELEVQDGHLVRAHELAEQALSAYPNGEGAPHARNLLARLDMPSYRVESMTNDGARKRSIRVTHRHLRKLYFRAYLVDLLKRVGDSDDYNLLVPRRELTQMLGGAPAAAWSADLPATPDLREHATYVTPPLDKRGLYLIYASADAQFGTRANQVVAVPFIVTNLVMLSNTNEEGGIDVTVLAGDSGEPVAGVTIDLYGRDWIRKHTKEDSQKSDKLGMVRFANRHTQRNYFLVARKGDDATAQVDGIYLPEKLAPADTASALIYTDRSIYRPLQTIEWKIVAYRGRADEGRFRVAGGQPITVTLHDANGQSVAERKVTTNDFGSASGSFAIPAGRVLGGWSVRSSNGGQASLRVEEYKRPTFEVTLKDPDGAVRLGHAATIGGAARYYFGLPVASAQVRYRVTRQPVYPWWWGWFHAATDARSQLAATGKVKSDDKGEFRITFTPQGDERQATDNHAISYLYQVECDLTDEGGETRSATHQVRAGTVSIEARIDAPAFVREHSAGEITITRTALGGGAPRPGQGRYRLLALVQPAQTPLPADEPVPAPDPSAFRTAGDALRPRWEPTTQSAEELMARWKDGAERAHGELSHDAKGVAKISLPALPAGAYRVRYTSVDDFGAPYEAWKDVIVAGTHTPLALPLLARLEQTSVTVGGTARLLIATGLRDQPLFLDIYRGGKRLERRRVWPQNGSIIELAIPEKFRGGLNLQVFAVRDHQRMQADQPLWVPWDNKELTVSFATFRDLIRPGARETWRVTVKGNAGAVEAGSVELLAYMYDRSLDLFAGHNTPNPLGLYPSFSQGVWRNVSLGRADGMHVRGDGLAHVPGYVGFRSDMLVMPDGYGVGGPGMRGGRYYRMEEIGALDFARAAPMAKSEVASRRMANQAPPAPPSDKEAKAAPATPAPEPAATTPLRANFAETAFFLPHLITDAHGQATFEFTVPDSVTSWNVWVHAITRDLRAGQTTRETRSAKDLMVRPYVPRFLREGDRASIKVVVNNATTRALSGHVQFAVVDATSGQDLGAEFGLTERELPFTAQPTGGTSVTFALTAPRRVGTVALRVSARADDVSDGELRPVPVLPSRLHLSQSRFVTLKDRDRRTLEFADLAKTDDRTRQNEQLVVTLDTQLFYTVLAALPYLIHYPYECTEQTLNRFLSTGIVSSVFKDYPAVAKMAAEMSKRATRLPTWDATDPNRKMALEESPWLVEARGGGQPSDDLINVLDSRVAAAERDAALARLRKLQTASGGFPWFPGGPPSAYMTLYLAAGFARALEFKVEVPRDIVQRMWVYLAEQYRADYAGRMLREDCCWEFITFLNYVASAYPDPSWTQDSLTPAERTRMLDHSWKHWKQHSPLLKGYLALTLKRAGRAADAKLVWDSVMDAAKTSRDLGTFFAPEDRSWLWYNDTVETQAFALRVLTELDPHSKKRDGFVLWLLLNKKLNHWKSTRATAEVIYALVHYLEHEHQLGLPEAATVTVGPRRENFTFAPDQYVGKTQLVVPGREVDARTAAITVEKTTPGYMFASATWHFSTDQLPAEDRGDFFAVSRRYFLRSHGAKGTSLAPIAEGAPIHVGDEVEVQISLRSKHEAEYVHLRDPRAAGLEPDAAVSRYRWDLGLSWYEEIRDSGTNFFFERLPVGQYTFKYRLRANMSGTFRVGPAQVQSMYAPEFNAYSAGHVLTVAP
jgi:uncharacterized protein YfaS (alpha-2-macroglobulin family)